MAYSKKEEFANEEIRLADIAKALSHPARIRILKLLNDMNACMVGNLVEKLPLAQSTVSQHLKELKKAGFIEGEIEGSKICYCLNNRTLAKSKAVLDKLFSRIGCC